MSYIKPQTPLQHKDGDYFYPLTTIDQVIMEDGITRLNGADLVSVNTDGAPEGETVKVNADTLGGYPASEYIRSVSKAGFIYPLASSVVPEGFLLCDGAEYLRTEYSELFAAIGTIYGSGDGSTTFNVPNLQTRVPVGSGENYELGSTGGEESHTLTVDEMPSHRHTINRGTSQNSYFGVTSLEVQDPEYSTTTNPAGGDQPHNNMQPYTVVNYIIATGKNTGVSVQDVIAGAQALPLGIEYGGTGATNAEDALKNFGAMSMELLWENASPASEFATQFISIDLSKYIEVVIEFQYMTTLNSRYTLQYFVGHPAYMYMLGTTGGAAVRYSYVKTNGIDFGTSNFNGQQDDSLMIPTKVFGIKGEVSA